MSSGATGILDSCLIEDLLANASQRRLSPASSATTQRGLHMVPALTHGERFSQDGVPDLLSKEGFDLAWTQYQGLMVDKLNVLTEGTTDENSSTNTLLTTYARQPEMASLFNHASMAHNNHFFFDCLSPQTTVIPSALEEQLCADFTSIETLRKEFIATASAMFGPGFVWLVKLNDLGQYRLLTTYLAGSPYPAAHYRQQPTDMNTQSQQSMGGLSNKPFARQQSPQNSPGFASKRLAPGGVNLLPIVCVNTWEHVWLRDWGIGGKKWYLEQWWDRIDWDKAANRGLPSGYKRYS
ncbi:MAG: hypothetical protein M4579_006120 [Chaenotheca gracillima]|nr:MAG: hypothetical protein M4579_006120 [Chaenotheca gracillima]